MWPYFNSHLQTYTACCNDPGFHNCRMSHTVSKINTKRHTQHNQPVHTTAARTDRHHVGTMLASYTALSSFKLKSGVSCPSNKEKKTGYLGELNKGICYFTCVLFGLWFKYSILLKCCLLSDHGLPALSYEESISFFHWLLMQAENFHEKKKRSGITVLWLTVQRSWKS